MAITEYEPVAQPAVERTKPLEHEPSHRLRRISTGLAKTAGCVAAGAIIGLGIAEQTPTHVDVAGNDASIWLKPGQTYDQYSLDGVITGEKSTDRRLAGEPLGVDARINFNSSKLIEQNGDFNTSILPAYIQLFSDPEQIKSDTLAALEKHFLIFGGVGAGLGLAIVGGTDAYKRKRRNYNEQNNLDPTAAREYYAPERRAIKRVVGVAVIGGILAGIPSSAAIPKEPKIITGNPALAGTQLEGMQISGPLAPVFVLADGYIEKYFDKNDKFYNQEQKLINNYLAGSPIQLPASEDNVNLGFATDRHCNIGMDRVILPIMQHYKIDTLLSAGDDYLNSDINFPGCTSGLAEKTKKAGIADDFTGGNHDSIATQKDEAKQGITVLSDKVVSIKNSRIGVIGELDPRRSDFGEPIQPSSSELREELVLEQGARIGAIACKSKIPVIAVLHDPRAGQKAIETGCGHVVLALDGHTHQQAGPKPTDTALPKGGSSIAYQFTGGSTGGAPGPEVSGGNFLDQLTVGPLNHDAYFYIVSINKKTGELAAITTFEFTPDQELNVTQTIVDSFDPTGSVESAVTAKTK